MPSPSLFDFINFFPLQAVQVPRSPINDKEARTLFKIWNSEKDAYNGIIVPHDADPLVVAALISKGLVISKQAHPSLKTPTRVVEMSKRGKEIIRNIILQTEKSAFERTASDFSYEAIYNQINKTASRIERYEPRNWLERSGLWN